MGKEITIYDIASQLQLSPATVSRALNNHPAINEKTKVLVNTKAEELGYRSNKFASNLRKQKTNTIGVIVPRLNSYIMSTVIAGMEKVANDEGFNLIISQSLESQRKEIANTKTMFNSRVDGLLVSVAFDTDSFEHFQPFLKKKIPLIFFDRIFENSDCPNIVIDNAKGGYEATKHLIEQGFKNIIHITGNLKRNVYSDRLKGYQQALSEFGILFKSENVWVTALSLEAGKEVAHRIKALPIKPDALFVSSDLCAVSCIATLKDLDITVPNDIAVVGFNNDPVSQVISPKLTTIHYPAKEMGEMAVKSMINHLKGNFNLDATNTITLRSELIVRESSLFLTHS